MINLKINHVHVLLEVTTRPVATRAPQAHMAPIADWVQAHTLIPAGPLSGMLPQGIQFLPFENLVAELTLLDPTVP